MKLRVISLLLVLALMAALIPLSASAAATTEEEIQQQIRSTYRTALHRSGKSSFNGFCGSLVNWQTCILGIDDHVYGCDGKNEFDMYSKMGTTAGGYRVKSYPASQYTLKEALNAITCNGTVDAYNILVGFQKTNTTEGSVYGHALLIHAILDGTVYFMECYNTSLGGRYWAEGSPIYCSIDTFCDYYNRWTVFDGIAYFGVKSYADVCQEYPADMYAMAMEDASLYAEPFDSGVNEAEMTGNALVTGDIVRVTALLQTPGGEYWYQLQTESGTAYVAAGSLQAVEQCFDDVKITNLKVPTALRKSVGCNLSGAVMAANAEILSVEVIVYAPETGMEAPLFSGSLEVNGKSVSLGEWNLNRFMTFRNLQAGTYRITILAQLRTYVLDDGEAVGQTTRETLWNSEFRIITDWRKYAVVTFDGNGGEAQLDQLVVGSGQAVGTLPQATRNGWLFTGWTLDAAGEEPVTEETQITGDVTLYAQWREGNVRVQGWQNSADGWHYYVGGSQLCGWFASNGMVFYQGGDGTLVSGWQQIDGTIYFFNEAGVRQTGWQVIDGDTYYLYPEGGRAVGWFTDASGSYYFDSDGKLHCGWLYESGNYYYLQQCGRKTVGDKGVDGMTYHFSSDGILEYAQQLTGDGYYVVYDRNSADQQISPDKRLLLG